MADKRIFGVFLLLALLTAALLASRAEAGSGLSVVGWMRGRSACGGTIGECAGGEEFDLATESNRRILATSGYISYNSLKSGSVPCSRRGASYYNCRAGGQANPYSRGCSRITTCRS